jgi:eukaryotic-like serine/threonine-protein kinase
LTDSATTNQRIELDRLAAANPMSNPGDGKPSKHDPSLDTVDGKRTKLSFNPNALASDSASDGLDTTCSELNRTEILPAVGEYLGKYRVQSEIGRGGMGVVLSCQDTRLRRSVAVKLLSSQYLANAHIKRRFLHEARTMSQIQHPGVIPVLEIGTWKNNRPFFAMEFVSGQSLDCLIKSTTESDEKGRLIKAFEHVCQTMAFVHSIGIAHLDLKPGNILIGSRGQIYVMDWGLSRTMRVSPDIDHEVNGGKLGPDPQPENHVDLKNKKISNRISGTPAYLSPEQARGDIVDARTDVFCLGGMLCEILTGQPPYMGSDIRNLIIHAANADLTDAFDRLDCCDEDSMLVRLAKRCLSSDPNDRPHDATEVATEIASFTETALVNAQSDLTRFFELSLDLFCIASFDGYFLRVNSNFSRVLGYSTIELVSKAFMEFVHPDDIQPTIDAMGALISGNPVIRFRNRYRNVAGNYVCFEWTAKSIPEEQIVFAVAREIPND